MSESAADQPILVWGDALRDYDFGPGHPLTPKRFGPGVDLVRAVGAERVVEPAEATDEELERLHAAHFIEQVRSCLLYTSDAADDLLQV